MTTVQKESRKHCWMLKRLLINASKHSRNRYYLYSFSHRVYLIITTQVLEIKREMIMMQAQQGWVASKPSSKIQIGDNKAQ